MMKKMLGALLAVALCAAMLAGCATPAAAPAATEAPMAAESPETTEPPEATRAPEATEAPVEPPAETFSDVPLETVTIAKDNPDYYKAAFDTEYVNYKLIRSLPTAYSEATWKAYMTACSRLPFIDAENIDTDARGFIDACIDAREALAQIRSFADSAWFIWGDSIPCAEDEATLEFTYESWDYPGFKPFLVPYLLKDQSAVKGNMIVVAGGGYSQRSNTGEGYPIAKDFNAMGYNAYVLQRRVAPYTGKDVWMDMQRSIRYIRYYAEELGLGGIDTVLATGFSGGGGTISGAIVNCYGDIQPTIYDADYVPDAVDAVNSDLDVAIINYGPAYDLEAMHDGGAYNGFVTDNPNLPAVMINAGQNDTTVPALYSLDLYRSLNGKTLVELHVFANATHGFGAGQDGNNSIFWIPMADSFVDLFLALREKAAK